MNDILKDAEIGFHSDRSVVFVKNGGLFALMREPTCVASSRVPNVLRRWQCPSTYASIESIIQLEIIDRCVQSKRLQ